MFGGIRDWVPNDWIPGSGGFHGGQLQLGGLWYIYPYCPNRLIPWSYRLPMVPTPLMSASRCPSTPVPRGTALWLTSMCLVVTTETSGFSLGPRYFSRHSRACVQMKMGLPLPHFQWNVLNEHPEYCVWAMLTAYLMEHARMQHPFFFYGFWFFYGWQFTPLGNQKCNILGKRF